MRMNILLRNSKNIFFSVALTTGLTFAVDIPISSSAYAQIEAPKPLDDFDPFLPELENELGSDDDPQSVPEDDSFSSDVISEDVISEIVPKAKVEDKPDYSELSQRAEREARLNDLFAKLKDEDVSEDANLIAEEIWALWLDSGSASINLVLRRGSDAQVKMDVKKARRMFDHVTDLSPDYAEGWARSSRLALEENDYSRALNEAVRALTLEPRHFYALWTLGNVFEQLGRQDEALQAYREANALYPELAPVKSRLEQLESEIEGDVL